MPGPLPLAGCRVLVLEDEYYLAADLEAALKSAGAQVVGPISELSKALEQLAYDGFEIAVVDVNLQGESAYKVADELQRQGIPFVFATGYSAHIIPARFHNVTRWEKPYNMDEIIADIVQLCSKRRASNDPTKPVASSRGIAEDE